MRLEPEDGPVEQVLWERTTWVGAVAAVALQVELLKPLAWTGPIGKVLHHHENEPFWRTSVEEKDGKA